MKPSSVRRTKAAKRVAVPKVAPVAVATCGECGGRSGCCNETAEPHSCPYAEEINGDATTECTCCASCQHECAMDI